MATLRIEQKKITEDVAKKLVGICPFGAISYDGGKLSISSACKMCKLCVKNGEGAVTLEEEETGTVDKSAYRGICVFADCQGGNIHRVTYELCGKAKELAAVTGHPVYALLIGYGTDACCEKLRHYGLDKIFVYDDKVFESFRIEPYTEAFSDFIEKVKPSSVLVGATDLGRQLAPRVAARWRAGLTADCTVLEMRENTDLVQIRPAFGGNIMAEIISPKTRPQFCTVRYKVFDEPKPSAEPSGEIVRMKPEKDFISAISVIETKRKPEAVDIAEAEVIVAVGRGAASEEMRRAAAELAELLSGTVACTRPLAESGIYDAKRQIGLSGRTVKPKLIITLGVSGAVQFAAGMKSSDVIVAVNTDRNAPIFDIAHFCVVGDAMEIVPALIKKIKEARADVQ